VVGGDQPQTLVNAAAAAIYAGDCRAILLSGAEATAAMKAALKAGITLDWSTSAEGECDDRGLGPMLLSAYEIANGLGAPTQTYPAFEHALAARLGHDRAAHRALMSKLWAGFSRVAARNPFAQFPVARDEAFLSAPSGENYPLADPYLKWDVAQDAVNQGAALILTSAGEADRLGIAETKRVYLHGHASAKDRTPSERPDLSRSLATDLVLRQTLEGSGCTVADIAHIDLYSCFPVAVLLAAETLGLDPVANPEGLTLTGGLPFFGGAGNNYSMHAIAEAVARCRTNPGSRALVLANGGFLSKEAAGVYSTAPLPGWQPQSSAAIQAECDAQAHPPLLSEDAEGTLETFTVTYAKGEAQRGYAFLRTDDDARILARTAKGEAALLAAATRKGVAGQRFRVRHSDGVNTLAFDGDAR
jgi:acetyl-CoA C-acetyltransferase